jgi:ParB family chromosome partitioning protein
MKKSVLGKGLSAILGDVESVYESEITSVKDKNAVLKLDVSKIKTNPYQPRKFFDKNALKELADSIRDNGLLQPICVFKDNDDYILIAGERRLQAVKSLGLREIKAIIINTDFKKLRELALIENIQRENLNAIELAKSYKELIEDYGITQEELSNIVHKSRSAVTNTLRLLKLSDYVQEQISNSSISAGHAKILVGLDEEKQKNLVDSIIDSDLSVRETEKLVKNTKDNDIDIITTVGTMNSIDVSKLQDIFNHSDFKGKVNKNSVVLSFDTQEEFELIYQFFSKKI